MEDAAKNGVEAVTRGTGHPTLPWMRGRGTSPGMQMVLGWFHPLLEQFLSLHSTVETTWCFGVFVLHFLPMYLKLHWVNLGLWPQPQLHFRQCFVQRHVEGS